MVIELRTAGMAVVLGMSALFASVGRAQELYQDVEVAQKRAAAAGRLTVVLVTGSDWDTASKYLVKGLLRDKKSLRDVARFGELAHLDFRIYDREPDQIARREKVATALRKMGITRFDLIPCAIVLNPNGVVRQASAINADRRDLMRALDEMATAVEVTLVSALAPSDAKEHLDAAQALFQSGKIEEASDAVQEALADDKTNMAAWELLSTIESQRSRGGGVRAARTSLALSVGQPPRGAAPEAHQGSRWHRLGTLLSRGKRTLEATFCFRMAASVDPTNFMSLLESAALCMKAKDKAGALRDAHLALKRDVGNPIALELRSKILPKSLQ